MSGYKDRIKAGIEKCENARRTALHNKISAFDLMEQTTQIVRDMIRDEFRRYAPQKGMAVFFHGSASRNELVTYSDVDIFFIETVPSSKAIENILRALVYGFGKVDELEGRQKEVIERYVRHSLTDRNKVIFAQFIAGDPSISNWVNNLQICENTLDYAVRHIIFQKYYLTEYYYRNKNTEGNQNVKYQEGGTYDLLMYTWFDNAMSLYRGNGWVREPKSNRPDIESTLKNLNKNGILSDAEYETVRDAAEFIILLRNEILRINMSTRGVRMAHLDRATERQVLESAHPLFRSQNISTPDELHRTYEVHRKVIHHTRIGLLKTLLREEEKRKGDRWKKLFDMAERGELSTPSGDPLIDIAAIWGLNHVGDARGLNSLAKKLKWNWGTCASMACSNLASPELLESIRSYCQPFPELGYVLRVIAENPNATEETLTKIAEDSSKGFWSAVARDKLEERHAATANSARIKNTSLHITNH